MEVSRDDQALAASALVQGLQADAPIGFAVHDEELRFLLVSNSLAATNGMPAADHLGRRLAEVLPAELAAAVDGMLGEVRDTGVARTGIEIDGATHARPDEIRSWVAGYYPVALGGRRLVGAVLVDVTDRRRAQEALSESEAELSGAQRMAGVGWWTWTAHPEAVVYAPELLWLMGRDPSLGGTPHARDQLEMADPEELDSVRAMAMASLETGRPFARRIRARHADGRLRLLEARADVVRDATGRAVGLQGFLQDVTELARAEQRQRAIAELGQHALEGRDLDALLQHAVDAVGREIGVDGVGALEALPGGREARVRAGASPGGFKGPRLVPIEPGGVIDLALTTREPVVVADLLDEEHLGHSTLERAAGARSVVIVAIDGPPGPFGVIGAMSARPHHFHDDDAAFLTAVANVLADAVERCAAQEQIAEISAIRGRLVAQAIDAEDRARRTISEALHDGALQELIAVRNELFGMTGRGGDDAALEAAQLRLAEILAHLREVMSALHPTVLQYGGLEAALHAVAEQHAGAAFETAVTVEPSAAGTHDELVLSLARELLENTAQHASASRAEVTVRAEPSAVVLCVADDGAGFPPGRLETALARGAIGVASCRERVEALGGTFLVHAAPGAGTRAEARIPAGVVAGPDRSASIPGDTDPLDGE